VRGCGHRAVVTLDTAQAVGSAEEVTPVTEQAHVIDDLLAEVSPPSRGILSRTIHDGEDMRLVLFGFAPGEELSEHTAARSAVIHVLAGDADVAVPGLRRSLGPGAWIHLPAHAPHSILAVTPLTIALYLLGPTVRDTAIDPQHGAAPA
jgi:quercetin dioxygenase-like cupin family protein